MKYTLFDRVKVWLHMKERQRNVRVANHIDSLPWGDDYLAIYKAAPPLMAYEGGFGYQGVLLMRIADEKYQCHLCGEWHEDLSLHVKWNHKPVTPLKYKEMVGLGKTAKIRSMKFLQKMKEVRQDWMEKNPGWEKKTMEGLKKGWKRSKSMKGTKIGTNGSNTMQFRNGWATCDAQLGYRLKKLHEELGRPPKQSEVTFLATLCRRFGSFNQALEHYGYPTRTNE